MELKKYKLGEIAEIVNGATPSTSCEDNYDGEIVWITPKDLSDQKTKYIECGSRNITQKGFNSCSAQIIPAYNILMSSRAPIGLLAINKTECCTNQGFKNIVIDRSICDVDFLYYYLKYHIKEVEALGSGTTFKEVSKASLQQFEITIPSLDAQKHIASVLADIDQKIALNRAINDNLEAIAKQLYDYWFVQFDFPNEEGKPYKSNGGKMVWNDKLKREIPEGWEVCNLSNYLHIVTERVSSNALNENTKYAPIEVLPRKKMSFNECAPIENAISGLCAFQQKNILLSNRRVYFHKVCIAPFDGITRDTVIVLRPINQEMLGYSYQLVNDDVFIEYATRHSYGSEQPVLSWESAKMYNVLKPKFDLDVVYSKFINSIIDCVIKNEVETAILSKQRDELLPLLMNGQVSVNYHLSHD